MKKKHNNCRIFHLLNEMKQKKILSSLLVGGFYRGAWWMIDAKYWMDKSIIECFRAEASKGARSKKEEHA